MLAPLLIYGTIGPACQISTAAAVDIAPNLRLTCYVSDGLKHKTWRADGAPSRNFVRPFLDGPPKLDVIAAPSGKVPPLFDCRIYALGNPGIPVVAADGGGRAEVSADFGKARFSDFEVLYALAPWRRAKTFDKQSLPAMRDVPSANLHLTEVLVDLHGATAPRKQYRLVGIDRAGARFTTAFFTSEVSVSLKPTVADGKPKSPHAKDLVQLWLEDRPCKIIVFQHVHLRPNRKGA